MATFMDEPVQREPIRVCLRLRPMNKLEEYRRSHNCAVVHSNNNNDQEEISTSLSIDSPLQGEFKFVYDRIFDEFESSATVYRHAAAPLANDVLEGFNCALVVYGQTGSGKTHTMMGRGAEQGGHTRAKREENGGTDDEHVRANDREDATGMIHRAIKDIFRLMAESSPTVEYTVRCSYVEIYLEKVLDLLNPVNRSIRIHSGMDDGNYDGGGANNEGEGARMEGASEACCHTESDVLSLLMRGNACRSVSSTKMNTDSSRSHAIFIIKIEQTDSATGISKKSQFQMMDMAGSELGGRRDAAVNAKGRAIRQEARMINKSLASLNAVVNALVANGEGRKKRNVPYGQSKLTRLLRDAFGGNCRTSIILTASPASYNIEESIRTMKFGHCCKSVNNFVKPSVEMSPVDYRKLLNDSQKKQGDLIDLVNELSAECFQLKQDAKNHNFVESKYNGPLWQTVEAILVNGAAPVVAKSARSGRSNDSSDVVALREELAKARIELEASKKARDRLENLLAERQSEVAVLRTQNDNYSSEKKKNYTELISARNEIRILSQRKQEVEHNLRTSQFREYEATVFLRQFRRFYRRLLKNKAAQGTGGTAEVIEKVPGVPDLNDLIDVDSLLLESGLIEESELHDDTATGVYRPSAAALGRSTEASSKAWKEAAALGKVEELTALDRMSFESRNRPTSQPTNAATDNPSQIALNGAKEDADGADAGAGSSRMPYGQTITNRQQFLGTPAGRLTTMRERELERDLLRATERCIELQVALNEEKANVDILTNRAGNLNKKKFAQESIQLKQQLDKKTHDLQAIIWKMNELHLINKTYNEKMSNREQHVTYLEENLLELQNSNRNIIMERQEAEDKLRQELESLKVLVDAMTIPLWQFGECGVTGRTLASRIRLPVRGGEYIEENAQKNDGSESLESLEESVVSEDEEEEDEMDESVEAETPEQAPAIAPMTPQAPAPVQQVQIIQQKNVPMRDASTQTLFSSQEKGTMTDAAVMPQTPPPKGALSSSATSASLSTFASAAAKSVVQQHVGDASTKEDHSSVSSSSFTGLNSSQQDVVSTKSNTLSSYKVEKQTTVLQSPEDLFRGGKSPSSQPRRFVHKFGLMIRPGVLKESSSKPKDSSSRIKS
ncbi:hypothetical protein ACHAWX_005669 [Stephanocyclus meneghinianus]